MSAGNVLFYSTIADLTFYIQFFREIKLSVIVLIIFFYLQFSDASLLIISNHIYYNL